MLQIISKRKIWFTISSVLVLVSVLALVIWGLNPAIDFTGGSLMEVQFNNAEVPAVTEVTQSLTELEVGEVKVQSLGDDSLLLRLKDISEQQHQEVLSKIRQDFAGEGEIIENRFESIGPVIGQELAQKAKLAMILVTLMIIIYIAIAFRKVSKPVASWKYGLGAIVALVHDVVIVTGVFAVLGHFGGVEIDILFITALLTILGYSVNDTIVVYDRTRENLHRHPEENFEQVVNRSVNETITRSINTSLTTLLVLLAIFFFGGHTIKYFVLALILGAVVGTYSSIFIASPLIVAWNKFSKKKA